MSSRKLNKSHVRHAASVLAATLLAAPRRLPTSLNAEYSC
jgi:hypothetical protein